MTQEHSALRVVVDRSSVAAGDDIDSHVREWHFPAEASVGDVVLRMLDEHYLPTIDGPVAWLVRIIHQPEFAQRADGLWITNRYGGAPLFLVAVFDRPYDVQVARLSSWAPGDALTAVDPANREHRYAMFAEYVPNFAMDRLDELRAAARSGRIR